MRHFFRQAVEHSKGSRLERLLLMLLPLFIIIFLAAVLVPLISSVSLRSADTEPVMVTTEPDEAEGIAHLSDEDLALILEESEPSSEPEPDYSLSDTPTGWRYIASETYYYDLDGRPVRGLQSIEGKLYFFDQYGVKADQLGIDVSFYNKFINWPAVAAQGIDYAILRAGGRGWETGIIYTDNWFQRNLFNARAAGLKLGVYFYSTATTPQEAQEEALYVLSCLNGAQLEMPIFIDVEYSGNYPHGRADTLTENQREVIINAFCQTVIAHGYKAGIYSGQSYFKTNLHLDSYPDDYTIWLASYTRGAALPSFPWSYDIWQFTDSGYVNGISGIVDMNASFK